MIHSRRRRKGRRKSGNPDFKFCILNCIYNLIERERVRGFTYTIKNYINFFTGSVFFFFFFKPIQPCLVLFSFCLFAYLSLEIDGKPSDGGGRWWWSIGRQWWSCTGGGGDNENERFEGRGGGVRRAAECGAEDGFRGVRAELGAYGERGGGGSRWSCSPLAPRARSRTWTFC